MKKFLILIVMVMSFAIQGMAQSGYRGFVDGAVGINIYDDCLFGGAVSTTHGYQFNNHIFAGVGVELGTTMYSDWYWGDDCWSEIVVPFYAQFRYDFSVISNRSFYGGTRIGYSLAENVYGVYFAPEFGIRLFNGKSISWNFGLRGEIFPSADTYDVPINIYLTAGIEF